ncbi:MAG: ABC transporter ATP-binding protein [Bacteroidota bacterium]
MEHYFSAEDIVKQYANHLALDKVSIHVPKGSIYGLLGPNGAGKTTLIRIINQITAPDEGKLYLNGRKMKTDDIYHIGYLPEERGLYKKMKVGEQVLYLAQLKGVSKTDAMKRLKSWFEKFEIQPWWNKKVEELSKGMQQKIQFITTMIHEPELMIFDEPFSGFDPINTRQLKNEILELRDRGTTILFSTHNMESVEELCDHITLINNAQAMIEGKMDDIKNRFKSNTFDVRFTGDYNKTVSSLNGRFEVIKSKPGNEMHEIAVKVEEDTNPNELIQNLIKTCQLHGFTERLPRMNDIFIKVVEKIQKN